MHRQFQLTEDDIHSVGCEMDEDFPARLDTPPFRGRGGRAIPIEGDGLPVWVRRDDEPGSLFRRARRAS